MLPIGPLMIEHRLIERMIGLLRKEAGRLEREHSVNVDFLNTAIDFILVYADRLHHGKEEDLLFEKLGKKDLSNEHRTIMEGLYEDHRQGRNAVFALAEAKEQYAAGRTDALTAIIAQMKFLVEMYPRHIDTEDRHFFTSCLQYLTDEEKKELLAREFEFDRNIIHQVYKDKVSGAE